MQIASSGKARRQGGSTQNSAFLVSSTDTPSVVSVPNSNTGIWVSIPEEGYRYPFVDPPGIDTWGGVSVPKFLKGT
ncbi:hypothetical protein GQ457_01G022960 [Hibiscus cannabinus]